MKKKTEIRFTNIYFITLIAIIQKVTVTITEKEKKKQITNGRKMKKNLLYLTKKILKYFAIILLIILLIRYGLHVNIISQVNVHKRSRTNVEKFKLYLNTNRSIDFDLSYSIIDPLANAAEYSHSTSFNEKEEFIYVNNFSSFLSSKFFYFDRDFPNTPTQTHQTMLMCSYVPENLGFSTKIKNKKTKSFQK